MCENNRYYISSGEKNMMYTLRRRFDEWVSMSSSDSVMITRDNYVRNLSIDANKAIEKAKLFIKDGAILLSNSDNLEDLEEIRRRESEEIKKERERREAQYEIERESRNNNYQNTIIYEQKMPFGVHCGKIINTLPKGYLLFWIEFDNEDDDVVIDCLQKYIISHFPELANIPKPNGNYIGNPKERMKFTATLVASFGFDGYYGWVNIAKFVTETGESLTYMGGNDIDLDIGDKMTFKATIKKHEEYKGEASTYINRIKEIKSK